MQGSLIGIGPALRKARERRGLSLEEASRDTRIRVGSLDALEREDFSSLPGEVYVRGSLRTYAKFLGVNPDKVLGAYGDRVPDGGPTGPPSGPVANPAMTIRRGRYGLAVMMAAAAIAAAAMLGILSGSHSSPEPGNLPATAPPLATDHPITAALVAHGDVDFVVTADGVPSEGSLKPGEQVTFEASQSLTIHLSEGGWVEITVNGVSNGRPGSRGAAWEKTFSYGRASPSPTG